MGNRRSLQVLKVLVESICCQNLLVHNYVDVESLKLSSVWLGCVSIATFMMTGMFREDDVHVHTLLLG